MERTPKPMQDWEDRFAQQKVIEEQFSSNAIKPDQLRSIRYSLQRRPSRLHR